MVAARLLVERGSIKDKSQDWGEFDFVSLPSPGDRIAVDHKGTTHYLTVLCVHHKPASLGGDAPQPAAADVVAKWTGSER